MNPGPFWLLWLLGLLALLGGAVGTGCLLVFGPQYAVLGFVQAVVLIAMAWSLWRAAVGYRRDDETGDLMVYLLVPLLAPFVVFGSCAVFLD